jgi:uncharacterized protein YoxC
MLGLSGLGLKIAIAGIIVTVVGIAIGGFFVYQKSIVSGLEEIIATKQATINKQKEQISGLILDTDRLKLSNTSLEAEISRKSAETKEAFAEIKRTTKSDLESTARLQEVERLLADQQRIKRHDRIRSGRKASLLLGLLTKNAECFAVNFNKIDGKCIRGKWVPTGGRLVPKTVVPSKPTTAVTEKPVK